MLKMMEGMMGKESSPKEGNNPGNSGGEGQEGKTHTTNQLKNDL